MPKLSRMLFGEKRACNHVTKDCLITHKYSSYFLERSLDRPKRRKMILCTIIISPQMHHDHWSNLELFSTANLDYSTNNASWKKAFRGGLDQHKLPGEPSQAHPLPRSLQMCSTWYFQTEKNRRNCSVWDGYEKTPLMLLPSAISSPRNWGERAGAM